MCFKRTAGSAPNQRAEGESRCADQNVLMNEWNGPAHQWSLVSIARMWRLIWHGYFRNRLGSSPLPKPHDNRAGCAGVLDIATVL